MTDWTPILRACLAEIQRQQGLKAGSQVRLLASPFQNVKRKRSRQKNAQRIGETTMALRGKKPTTVDKRLKALFYGPPNVGKTTAAIQFPRPYLIDTEKGATNDQYVKALNDVGGLYYFTTDPDELIAEVRTLISEKHDYRTLIIDPLTIIYNDLLDRGAEELGTEFGRHKQPANRKIKHLLQLITRLDMNVIITSHAKAKWERSKNAKGQDTVTEVGVTYDCYDKLEYLFDLTFEIQKRGLDRVGIVRKTRVEAFPEGDVFPFSYDEIARRYGKEVLEKASKAVALATADQVAELEALLEQRKDADQLRVKWLEKAEADSFDEMPADAVAKCISFLAGKAVAHV